jgi:hypothetical protein
LYVQICIIRKKEEKEENIRNGGKTAHVVFKYVQKPAAEKGGAMGAEKLLHYRILDQALNL